MFLVSGDLAYPKMGTTTTTPGMHLVTIEPGMSFSRKKFMSTSTANFGGESKVETWKRLTSTSHISSKQPFFQSFSSGTVKLNKAVTRAMSGAADSNPVSKLPIDLRG